MKRNTTIEVLLLGGKGTIGTGLRKFLPQLDSRYKFTIVDFNDSDEKLENIDPKETFIHFDISNDSEKLKQTLLNKDLIIYLARKDPLNKMNEMTDLVFSSIQEVCSKALVIGSSSVHATGGAYFPFSKKPYSIIAKREFNKIIDDILKNIPQSVNLKLPKLKKVSGGDKKPAKLKLPKLKKVT